MSSVYVMNFLGNVVVERVVTNRPRITQAITKKRFLAGIDEAGRGPLAGPVTAACVVMPTGFCHPEVTDSKLIAEKKREELFEYISGCALAYSIVSVGPKRIETLNILQATRFAMRLAAKKVHRLLTQRYGEDGLTLHLLIDGNREIETDFTQRTVVKGDSKIKLISAASILAKVVRDRLMCLIDQRYPGYGFAEHKGYPTSFHRERILALGPSTIHRRTFAGVEEFFCSDEQISLF